MRYAFLGSGTSVVIFICGLDFFFFFGSNSIF